MDYNQLLKGKRVFVTTGIRGIGKAIAVLFAEQGAIVAVGGKNHEHAKSTEEELQKINPACKVFECNLAYRDQVEEVCDKVLALYGGIDILVNSVGINHRMPAHEYSEEELDLFFEINYRSGIRCMKKFMPGMLERGYGNIVNISSIHSITTMPGNLAYAGTKGAINASARAMALDYADKGIRVNNICPGLIMSDVVMDEVKALTDEQEKKAYFEMLSGMQPLAPGKMEDIANAALYFASDMSSYVTGQTLLVDGGASIKAHP